MRNVEIKARLEDVDSLVKIAEDLSNGLPTVIEQNDTFFNTTQGRLKLRIEKVDGSTKSTLIYYERPDTTDAKLSDYELTPVTDPSTMKSVLSRAYGIKGEVTKMRKLFLIGQTRVHVDSVEGLGEFVELEVVLSPEETVQKGEEIAKKLMDQLGISESCLLTGAYMDMLKGK